MSKDNSKLHVSNSNVRQEKRHGLEQKKNRRRKQESSKEAVAQIHPHHYNLFLTQHSKMKTKTNWSRRAFQNPKRKKLLTELDYKLTD